MLLTAAAQTAASAAHPDRIEALQPTDGAVSGPRAVFQIGYEGAPELRAGELRFRLTLEPTGEEAEGYVFDQRRTRSGWFAGDEGQVVYRARKPLRDGSYRWRAWYWNGTDWVGGTPARRLRIDGIPPAEVGALSVAFDAERGEVRLEWEPVVRDRDGGPEFVTRYRVYRHEKRKFPGGVKTLEIGEVLEPGFVDDAPPANESRILYYKVIAEDQAGNVSEGR